MTICKVLTPCEEEQIDLNLTNVAEIKQCLSYIYPFRMPTRILGGKTRASAQLVGDLTRQQKV
jgi:hypothetical protein